MFGGEVLKGIEFYDEQEVMQKTVFVLPHVGRGLSEKLASTFLSLGIILNVI